MRRQKEWADAVDRWAGRGYDAGREAEDLKGASENWHPISGIFKFAIVIVAVFAACSTVFSVIGPKILGKATTALSEGLMAKIRGTGGIDFYLYRKDPAVCIGAVSSQCTVFVCAGLDYDRGDPEDLLPAPEGNLGEDQPDADEVF